MAVADCPSGPAVAYCLPAKMAEAGAQLTTSFPSIRLSRAPDGRLTPIESDKVIIPLFLREVSAQPLEGGTVFGQRDCKPPPAAPGASMSPLSRPPPRVTCNYAAAFVPEAEIAATMAKGWVGGQAGFLRLEADSPLTLGEVESALRYGPGEGAPVAGFAAIAADPVSAGECASLLGPFCIPKAYDPVWTYRFGIQVRTVDGQRYAPSQATVDQAGVRISLINTDSISFTPLTTFPQRTYDGGVLFANRQCEGLTCTYAALYVRDPSVAELRDGAILTPMEIAANSAADLTRAEVAISVPIETRAGRFYVPLSELPRQEGQAAGQALKETLPIPGIELNLCRSQGLAACIPPKAP